MEPTDFLAEAVRQHENLRQAVEALRAVREQPIDDDSYDRQRQQLTAQATQFKESLAAHFQFEEEGGYFSPLRTSRPGLLPQASKLARQHGQLMSAAKRLVTALERGVDLESAVREVDDLLDRLQRHEAAETALLQRSVIEDIGHKD